MSRQTLLFIAFFLLPVMVALAAQKKWVGLQSALWEDALNWSPAGLPGVDDDVLLDNTHQAGTYAIRLPNTNVTVHSIEIAPSGTHTIRLELPVTNTASPALTLTGGGNGLLLRSGATFLNASGLAAGQSISCLGSIRIENGARYIHNSRSVHAADIVAKLSTEPGTEQGIFEFDVPGGAYPVSLSNRIYGRLVFASTASGGTQTYNASGSNVVTVRGDLVVQTGVQLNLDLLRDFVIWGSLLQPGGVINLASGANANTMQLKGDWQMGAGAVLTESADGSPVLELSGNVHQRIACTGSITANVCVAINNSAGVSLESDLRLPYQLRLTNGKIKTSNGALLILLENCIVTGAGPPSFVDGPLQKIGGTDFQFPIGKQRDYAPLALVGNGAAADAYTAEYFLSDPRKDFGPAFDLPLIRISAKEYWAVKATAGESKKKIRLSVGTYSGATALDKLAVVQWHAGSQRWQNLGNTATVGVTAGTVTSNEALANSAFTIASTVDIQNPLPLAGLALTVDIQRNHTVLSATLRGLEEAGVCELQQSVEGRQFSTVEVKAIGAGDTSVSFEMSRLADGALFRLRFSSASGSGLLSNVVNVPTGEGGYGEMRVSSSTLWFAKAPGRPVKIRVEVFDVQLRRLSVQQQVIGAGQRSIPIDCPRLPAGIYLVRVSSEGRQIGVFRWVR